VRRIGGDLARGYDLVGQRAVALPAPAGRDLILTGRLRRPGSEEWRIWRIRRPWPAEALSILGEWLAESTKLDPPTPRPEDPDLALGWEAKKRQRIARHRGWLIAQVLTEPGIPAKGDTETPLDHGSRVADAFRDAGWSVEEFAALATACLTAIRVATVEAADYVEAEAIVTAWSRGGIADLLLARAAIRAFRDPAALLDGRWGGLDDHSRQVYLAIEAMEHGRGR